MTIEELCEDNTPRFITLRDAAAMKGVPLSSLYARPELRPWGGEKVGGVIRHRAEVVKEWLDLTDGEVLTRF